MVFVDMVHKMLNGEPIEFNFGYMLEQAKSNQVVAFLISVYYFIEKSIFSIKDFVVSLFSKVVDVTEKWIEK